MAVAYLPLSILLCFSTDTYFLFPRKWVFFLSFIFFNLDISTDLGKGLFFCVF